MNCSRIQDLLPDYAVELLDARTRATVESHLELCAECRAELRAQDAVMELVATHGVRQPPPGLFNAVRNRIESGDVVRERAPWWAWIYSGPARVAAMGMATAAVAVAVLMPTGKPASTIHALDMHPVSRGAVSTSAMASSIRQHAMSAGEGPLTDRVAWEAMAQLVAQDKEREKDAGVR